LNGQSSKDTFHNPIFDIDNLVAFGIFDSTFPINFSFQNGG